MGSVLSYSSIALVGAGILALLLALGSRSLLMGIPRDSGARGLALASGLLSILGVAACAVLFFLVLRQNSPLGEADVPGWLLLLSALVGLAAQITYLLCLRRIALRFFNADLAGRIVALLLFTVLAVGLAIGLRIALLSFGLDAARVGSVHIVMSLLVLVYLGDTLLGLIGAVWHLRIVAKTRSVFMR
ncbi:MAG: hypothetical protein U0793_15585 [Gemmataceae bacterium]